MTCINFGSNCTNCIGEGIITGPGEYRDVCPVCDGQGRIVQGHPTQKIINDISQLYQKEIKNVAVN